MDRPVVGTDPGPHTKKERTVPGAPSTTPRTAWRGETVDTGGTGHGNVLRPAVGLLGMRNQ